MGHPKLVINTISNPYLEQVGRLSGLSAPQWPFVATFLIGGVPSPNQRGRTHVIQN